MPSRKQKEKYALGLTALFPSLKNPFSLKGYVIFKKGLLPENTSFTGFGILASMIDAP